MKTEELRNKLISLGKDEKEINTIIENFEKTQKLSETYRLENKSYRQKINELIASNNFKKNDYRFFTLGFYSNKYERPLSLTCFVLNDGTTAKVSFSFLNNDDEMPEDFRAGKFYALVNFVNNKYTYETKWLGRSEFAVYDAIVANHSKFPGIYKKIRIDFGIGSEY